MPEIFEIVQSDALTDEINIGRYSRSLNGIRYPQQSVVASYSALSTDEVLYADATSGNITITLPAGLDGQRVSVSKVDSSANTVTIAGTSENVNGSTIVLTTQYESKMIQFTGTEWVTIA